MKSAIEELYRGILGTKDPDLGKEYLQALDKETEKANALLESIHDNSEAVKLFKEYQDATDATLCMEIRGHYIQGFRHGFRLAVDAMDED